MISLFLYGLYVAWPVLAAVIVMALVWNIGGKKKESGVLFPVAPMKNRSMWMTSDEFRKVYPNKSYKAYLRRSEKKHWS